MIHNESKIISSGNQKIQKKDNLWEENSETLIEDSNLDVHLKQVPNIIYAADDKQSDLTYLMMDNCSVNIGMYLKYYNIVYLVLLYFEICKYFR